MQTPGYRHAIIWLSLIQLHSMRLIPFLISTEWFGLEATAFWTFTRLIEYRHEAHTSAFAHRHELLTTLKANESDRLGGVVDGFLGKQAP